MAHVRQFSTRATRDDLSSKPDYEGYLSPLVIERFGRYMLGHQTCADGSQRASDNWQLGIPKDEYIKSLLRHVLAVWLAHRRGEVDEDAWCAILFNSQGYLYESLKGQPTESRIRAGEPRGNAYAHELDQTGRCVNCGEI